MKYTTPEMIRTQNISSVVQSANGQTGSKNGPCREGGPTASSTGAYEVDE